MAARQERRLARLTPSLSGFALLLALKGRTPGLQHHTVLFPSDYDQEFDAIFGPTPRPPEDPAIYICSPDDATMRPEGHEAWFVLVNTPPDEPQRGVNWRDESLVGRYTKRVLDLMAQRGLDARDRILWHEVRTPADIADRSWSPGGSIYGSSSNSRRAAFMRPANRSPISGLFLVGGSAAPRRRSTAGRNLGRHSCRADRTGLRSAHRRSDADVGKNLPRRRRPVEGVHVQSACAAVQQALAQLSRHLDPEGGHRVRVVFHRREALEHPTQGQGFLRAQQTAPAATRR